METTDKPNYTTDFVRATELPTTETSTCYAGLSECSGPNADLNPCDYCTELRERGDALEQRGEL